MIEIARFAHQHGTVFVLELSGKCEAWQFKMFKDLEKDIPCFVDVCKGCQVGLRDPEGLLLGKGWKIMTSSHSLANHMRLKCSGDHSHGRCEGSSVCRRSAYYTPAFAKRVILHFKEGDKWNQVVNELTDRITMADNLLVHSTHHGCSQGNHTGCVKGDEHHGSSEGNRTGWVKDDQREVHHGSSQGDRMGCVTSGIIAAVVRVTAQVVST